MYAAVAAPTGPPGHPGHPGRAARTVVVGLDPEGSWEGPLDAAVGVAHQTGSVCVLVAVVSPVRDAFGSWRLPSQERMTEAEELLAVAAGRARRLAPELAVATHLVVDDAVAGLLGTLAGAEVVVLGTDDRVPVTGHSVARQVAQASPCPVLLVPGARAAARPTIGA